MPRTGPVLQREQVDHDGDCRTEQDDRQNNRCSSTAAPGEHAELEIGLVGLAAPVVVPDADTVAEKTDSLSPAFPFAQSLLPGI